MMKTIKTQILFFLVVAISLFSCVNRNISDEPIPIDDDLKNCILRKFYMPTVSDNALNVSFKYTADGKVLSYSQQLSPDTDTTYTIVYSDDDKRIKKLVSTKDVVVNQKPAVDQPAIPTTVTLNNSIVFETLNNNVRVFADTETAAEIKGDPNIKSSAILANFKIDEKGRVKQMIKTVGITRYVFKDFTYAGDNLIKITQYDEEGKEIPEKTYAFSEFDETVVNPFFKNKYLYQLIMFAPFDNEEALYRAFFLSKHPYKKIINASNTLTIDNLTEEGRLTTVASILDKTFKFDYK